jgi:hypothetical protein
MLRISARPGFCIASLAVISNLRIARKRVE